ncbi:hypothetical protein AS589_09350 [Empedobacter brevis]|uniref:hypothetical protein n=1 Tax=Empedobacter brevis TaxID=247 RepID=UPI00131F6AEF|nr:hypothetical protein [Empedobacter brevis]QHC84961.1 hypothetical protein AS589_09350 [Empedobacter brevis]
MTKEEIIKEAFNYGYNSFHECNTKQDYEHHLKDCIESFKDTEDNNGWIKIQSEEDFPKEQGVYHINYSDGVISSRYYHPKHNDWKDHPNATHYQPIEKPKPPIY